MQAEPRLASDMQRETAAAAAMSDYVYRPRKVAGVVARSFFVHVPWLMFSVFRVLTGTSHLAVARAVVWEVKRQQRRR